jgi:hypothetical protein
MEPESSLLYSQVPATCSFFPTQNFFFRLITTNNGNEIHSRIRLSGLRLIPEACFTIWTKAA